MGKTHAGTISPTVACLGFSLDHGMWWLTIIPSLSMAEHVYFGCRTSNGKLLEPSSETANLHGEETISTCEPIVNLQWINLYQIKWVMWLMTPITDQNGHNSWSTVLFFAINTQCHLLRHTNWQTNLCWKWNSERPFTAVWSVEVTFSIVIVDFSQIPFFWTQFHIGLALKLLFENKHIKHSQWALMHKTVLVSMDIVRSWDQNWDKNQHFWSFVWFQFRWTHMKT